MRRAARIAAALALLLAVAAVGAAPALASGPTVVGAGSTWSQVAIEQWRSDVARQGLAINYSGVGSTAGRQFYINQQVDFAVSEIPFLPDEVRSLQAEHRSYQYLPIVAGGTSMMYNLRNASGQIRDLHLSSSTIAKIFTGAITNWTDPAIRADNPGLQLPSIPVVPVTRSDGSGTSAQFSAYLFDREPGTWRTFCSKSGLVPCASTSFWPPFGVSVQQRGSDGIANYVANPGLGVGSIGYVEAAYALARHMPVVSVENASHNFVQPTAANVAIALVHATLNPDRTQNLEQVYVAPEKAAYPISSYSYMITQTKGFDPAKGKVLGEFILYFVCTGQQAAERLGYSPLPSNLVQRSFDAVTQIPGAPTPPALQDCDNPYVSGSFNRTGSTGTPAPPTQATGTPTASVAGPGTPGGGNHGGGGSGSTTEAPAPGASSVPGAEGPDPAVYQAAAAKVTASARPPSSLPLVVFGVVVLLLVFGPLFLRLSRPGSGR